MQQSVERGARSAERRAQSAEREAQSAEREAQSAERGAQSAERGAQSAERGAQSALRSALRAPRSPVLWLDLPRQELYARINKRVECMMVAGLVEEVLALRKLPQPVSREATQALGYKEIFAYLDGRCSLAEATLEIQTRSRNFAKRQLTWFRRLAECRPITPELTFAAWGLTMDG